MLIGLSGYPRVGKDTLARELVARRHFTQIAIGDKIRELAIVLDPMLKEFVAEVGWDTAKQRPAIRKHLQDLATLCRHRVGSLCFLLGHLPRLAEVMAAGQSVVVSDVRHPDEARYIQVNGGRLVRLSLDCMTRPSHEVELLLDEFHFDVEIELEKPISDFTAAERVELADSVFDAVKLHEALCERALTPA